MPKEAKDFRLVGVYPFVLRLPHKFVGHVANWCEWSGIELSDLYELDEIAMLQVTPGCAQVSGATMDKTKWLC